MNRYLISILSVTGLIIGLLITLQFKTDKPVEGNLAVDEINARKELIKNFLDEQAYLQSRIVTLRQQIEESQKNVEAQTEFANLEVLDGLKQEIGLADTFGEGIEIYLNDGSSARRDISQPFDVNLIQASDIRDLVNILNAAKADAIAINNQRVIATSSIVSIGTTILVNNAYVSPPFTISAVGDTEIMLQRLLNEYLLPNLYERAKKRQVVFKIKKKFGVTVPIYNGDLRTKHINLIE